MINPEILSQIEEAIHKETSSSEKWYASAQVGYGALKLCHAAINAIRNQVNRASSSPQRVEVRELVRSLKRNKNEFTDYWHDEDGWGISTYNSLVRAIDALEPSRPRHSLPNDPVRSLVLRGRFLAVGRGRSIELWDFQQSCRVERVTVPGHSLYWSEDGSRLATEIGASRSWVEWTNSTTEKLRSEGEAQQSPQSVTAPFELVKVLTMPAHSSNWRPGESAEVTDASGETLWKIVAREIPETEARSLRFGGTKQIRNFHQVGSKLALDHHGYGGEWGTSSVTLWDLTDGRLIDTWEYWDHLIFLSLSPNAKRLVAIVINEYVDLRDAETGEALRVREDNNPVHDGKLLDVVWNEDSSTFATVGTAGMVIVRSAEDGKSLATIENADVAVTSTCWSDGLLLLGFADGWIHIYDGQNYRLKARLFSNPQSWIVASTDNRYDGDNFERRFCKSVSVGLDSEVCVAGRESGLLGRLLSISSE